MPLFGRPRLRGVEILDPSTSARGRALAAKANELTAGGVKVNRESADTYRRLVQPWQQRALSYYDSLGEVNYAAQFYSRMLGGLRLFSGVVQDDGTIEEDTDPKAIEALARMQDPGGGTTGLLSAYGRLMFLVGEAILFVSTDKETGLEQWEMLSQDELRLQGGIYMRYRAPSLGVEEYRASEAPDDEEEAWVPVGDADTGEAVAYRLWQRHPRYSYLADSTMKGILSICEELLLLEQSLRARLRSRVAGAGFLIIDDRVTAVPQEAQPDEDPDEDPVMAAIINAMLSPIADEGTASAVVPLMLRVSAGENGKVQDLIHHMMISDPSQLYPETGLRMECIRRMAISLDMPPEVLEGTGDVNHWSAWSIDEQTWKNHGQPKAQQFVDDVTAAYYRPYLRDVLKVADWDRRVVGYDASQVINHPDRTKDAKDFFDRVSLSKKALIEAGGFSEEDLPSEEERAERIGILTRDSSLAMYGIPSVKAGGIEPEPGEIVTGQGVEGAPTGGATKGSEVEQGPPPAGPGGVDDSGGLPASAMMIGRVLTACDMGMLRSREAAGARLWSLMNRDTELQAEMKRVRRSDLCATLGREKVRQLGAPTERDLCAGARSLIIDTLRQFVKLNKAQAEEIADAVEQHAIRTLYDMQPHALPETFASYLFNGRNGSG